MKNCKHLALFLGLVFSSIGFANPLKADENLNIKAKSALIVEFSTGDILYQKNADEKLPIASISKILTLYLVYQDIRDKKINWDNKVKISDYAYGLLDNLDISNTPMNKREYTVKELVELSLITSSNTATIALAEHLATSEKNFVDRMKKQLDSWNITDYLMVNSSGLTNHFLGDHIYPQSHKDDENQLSAKDLIFVARQFILDFPEVLDITSKQSIDFEGQKIPSSNLMLTGGERVYTGVDGFKTGTTTQAGPSFLATAKLNNMRVLTLVLNAEDKKDDHNRFTETKKLLDYTKDNFSLTKIISKGTIYQKNFPVLDGKKDRVDLIVKEDFYLVTQNGKKSNPLSLTPLNKPTLAPIKKGQVLARLTPKNRQFLKNQKPNLDLISSDTVELSDFGKAFILQP